MLAHPLSKALSLYLAIALIALTLPAQGWAMFLPAEDDAGPRAADTAKVRTALESRAVRQRLMDYGLTADEAMAKLAGLPDEQVHQLAANLDSLQAGDGAGTVVDLLIIALLVVLLIYLIEGRIEIRRR